MKTTRKSNFELLRCVLMLMVVVVHYNNVSMGKAFSYVEPKTANYYLLYWIESMAIIGTNGFILLTGYFSHKTTKVSLRKPVGLLGYVTAYNTLFYLMDILLQKEAFSWKVFVFTILPKNWYISLFVVLLILSPYINLCLNRLDKRGYLSLLTVLFVFISVWPTILNIASSRLGISTIGMNTVSFSGDDGGYSLVNFVFLYLIGAGISKYDLGNHKKRWDIIGYLVCTAFIFIQQLSVGAGWNYSNPLVILSGICMFQIFRKVEIQSNMINLFSKASLGVFLIHTHALIHDDFWSLFDIRRACMESGIRLGVNLLICCLCTYIVCSFVDMGIRFVGKPISLGMDKIPLLRKTFFEVENEN